ncbi:MAG: DUF3050 domain-containing protein [Betaproteobacteria bacterium]|nr:MAG: DUF3050 domain-containing protein [Betaproteobacteria bacterium]
MPSIVSEIQIAAWRNRLERHAVYADLNDLHALRIFMQHHVWSVWDFMSLIKYLQHAVAPAVWPWRPGRDASVQRFINELVLEEESDAAPPQWGAGFSSHFNVYLGAMREVGADTTAIERFVSMATEEGIAVALASGLAPDASRNFTATTFSFIDANKPHEVAAALALGREHVIPIMFRSLLARIGISEAQAPIFHFYLNRHIHLDEDFHAPLSLRLLESLCDDDPVKIAEACIAAEVAISARERFWDGVQTALH